MPQLANHEANSLPNFIPINSTLHVTQTKQTAMQLLFPSAFEAKKDVGRDRAGQIAQFTHVQKLAVKG
jgi:hypothetical protein